MTLRAVASGIAMTAPTRYDLDDPDSDVTFMLGTRQGLVYRGQIIEYVEAVESCYVTCDESSPEGKELGKAVLNHVQEGDYVVVEGDVVLARRIYTENDNDPDIGGWVSMELRATAIAVDVRSGASE